ncbi:MAG: hypothetical protein ABSD73_09475 [Candidatus Bathyarchaeia archaeon]|jgi:hypothetical protein
MSEISSNRKFNEFRSIYDRLGLRGIAVILILIVIAACLGVLVYLNQLAFALGIALSGLTSGGIVISAVNIRNYKELHTAKQFYEKSRWVVENSTDICIVSTTPGVILASEYDPSAFPFPSSEKSKFRRKYFDLLLKASASRDGKAEMGLKVKYFFDKYNAALVLKQYIRDENYKGYVKEGKKILEKFLKETNSNFKIRCGKIDEKSKFLEATIIGDKYIVYSNRDEETKKIFEGKLVENKERAQQLRDEFERELWQSGEKVEDASFIDDLIRE